MKYVDYEKDVKSYCAQNSLRFDSLNKMVRGYGKDNIVFMHHDPNKGKSGLLDETPMPVVLRIVRTEKGIRFEQTSDTNRFLR